jgi:hypothetical protein
MHAWRQTETFFGEREGFRAFVRSRFRWEHDVIINVIVELAKVWTAADIHCSPPNAKVENEWSCILTPHMPSRHEQRRICLGLINFKENWREGFSWIQLAEDVVGIWVLVYRAINIRFHLVSRPGSVVDIATGYGLNGPGIESRWGAKIYLASPDRPWGPPSFLYNGLRAFTGDKERPGRDANPSTLLVLWSWKSRAIPLLPLCAVRPVQSLNACTRVHITYFYHTFR